MFDINELEFLAECVDLRESKDRITRLNKAAMVMKIGRLQDDLAKEEQKKQEEKNKNSPPSKDE